MEKEGLVRHAKHRSWSNGPQLVSNPPLPPSLPPSLPPYLVATGTHETSPRSARRRESKGGKARHRHSLRKGGRERGKEG